MTTEPGPSPRAEPLPLILVVVVAVIPAAGAGGLWRPRSQGYRRPARWCAGGAPSCGPSTTWRRAPSGCSWWPRRSSPRGDTPAGGSPRPAMPAPVVWPGWSGRFSPSPTCPLPRWVTRGSAPVRGVCLFSSTSCAPVAQSWGVDELLTLVLAPLVTLAWVRSDTTEPTRAARQGDLAPGAELKAYNAHPAALSRRSRPTPTPPSPRSGA